jgi:hypothetical protein
LFGEDHGTDSGALLEFELAEETRADCRRSQFRMEALAKRLRRNGSPEDDVSLNDYATLTWVVSAWLLLRPDDLLQPQHQERICPLPPAPP